MNSPTPSQSSQQEPIAISASTSCSSASSSSLTPQRLQQQIRCLRDNNAYLRQRLEEEYWTSHNLAAQVENLQVDCHRLQVREADTMEQLQRAEESARVNKKDVDEAMDRVEVMRDGIVGFCKSMDVFERSFWGVEVTARVKKLEACLLDDEGTDDGSEEVNESSSEYTSSSSSSSSSSLSSSSSSDSSFSQEEPEDERDHEADDEEDHPQASGPPTHRRHSIKSILKLPRKPTITATLAIGALHLLSLPLSFFSKRHHVHFDDLVKEGDGGVSSSAATKGFLTQVNKHRVQEQGLFARFWWEKKFLFREEDFKRSDGQ